MTDTPAAALVRRSRADQGLPEALEDAGAIAALALLLRPHTEKATAR